MSESDLDLETRDGLSEPLRVLLAQYPREVWQANSRFHGLASFWIERHGMFRKISALMAEDTEAVLDSAMEGRAYGPRLSQLAGLMVQDLHGHHMIEDQHYFPELSRRDRRLVQGFAMLDKDHHALDGLIGRFIESTNTVLTGLQAGQSARNLAGPYLPVLARFSALIERHLWDEEELIVPVLLEYGDP